MKDKQKLLDEILHEVESDLNDEEILHLLIEKKIAANVIKKSKEKYTMGEKASDAIAKFVGSWVFIFIFIIVLFIWVLANIYFIKNAFDPYPFILLNLLLSCVAAIQAPLIMMSQNRQEKKDRLRAENDYKVNLKTEFIIQDLYEKIDTLLKNQHLIAGKIDKK
ncbi:MAG: DUF1003 domain-containing protein [Lachnospiraceae bacterium]|nr:DUF1003 domain-containing protein [Lachnospiraceae bacterium]